MTTHTILPPEETTITGETNGSGPVMHAKARTVSRRRLFQAAGGICVLVVGGTLYRANDQGVFSTGQGPAYDVWREFSAQDGAAQLRLVRAAVLATNAHNTQPWLFRLGPSQIDLYAVPSRNIGSIDPLRREM